MNSLINHIIQQLEEVQNGKPWVGSSYKSKLEELNEPIVFVRPKDDLHSIAEIISHLTFWRKEALLKIQTGTGSKTDDCEENWLTNEQLKPLGWHYILSEYNKTLTELINLLKTKDDSFLKGEYYDTDFKAMYPYSFLINGMLHHDLYHLGQLGIIIKHLKKK
ncbi:DinB family protein [Aegicerativicinus sediminis]|uniref:DinB family protein n=1 Tax=Aegicerativicinus sediminis TaxID=2893202 RepID=UPI001E4A41DF|nr:DinB family protein [Aegicerativicinus sediminis]